MNEPTAVETTEAKPNCAPVPGSARTSYPEEPFRLSVVIEYPNADAAPAIGKQECLGGTIVALQFSDALTEIERYRTALEEIKTNTLNSDPEHWVAVKALEAQNVELCSGSEPSASAIGSPNNLKP